MTKIKMQHKKGAFMASENRQQVAGKVGVVYATPTGNTVAKETYLNEGWQQATETERIKVIYRQISHTAYAWKESE